MRLRYACLASGFLVLAVKVLLSACASGDSGQALGEELFLGFINEDSLKKSCEYDHSKPLESAVPPARDKKSCGKLPHCTWDDSDVCLTDCGKLTPGFFGRLTGHKNSTFRCNIANGCAWDWNPKTNKSACVSAFDLGTSELFPDGEDQLESLFQAVRISGDGELNAVAKWNYLGRVCETVTVKKQCRDICSWMRSTDGEQKCYIDCGKLKTSLCSDLDSCYWDSGVKIVSHGFSDDPITRQERLPRCRHTNPKNSRLSKEQSLVRVEEKVKRIEEFRAIHASCQSKTENCAVERTTPKCSATKSEESKFFPCNQKEIAKCQIEDGKCMINCKQFDQERCREIMNDDTDLTGHKRNSICVVLDKNIPCLSKKNYADELLRRKQQAEKVRTERLKRQEQERAEREGRQKLRAEYWDQAKQACNQECEKQSGNCPKYSKWLSKWGSYLYSGPGNSGEEVKYDYQCSYNNPGFEDRGQFFCRCVFRSNDSY